MTQSLPPLPSLEGLGSVMTSARCGSFSSAAEELGITAGAVSRRVALVERWLGTMLFERHGRGVVVTPAGRRFLAEVEGALSVIARTNEQWRPAGGLPIVRMSTVPSFAQLWLLPRLQQLEGSPADLFVDLRVDHRAADLAGGETDVVVRYGRGNWPGAAARLLFGEWLSPAAAPAVAARLGQSPTPEAVATEALLHDSDTSQWRAWLSMQGRAYRPRLRDRRFEDYDMVLAAAEAGLGIVLLRRPLADDWVSAGRLVDLQGPACPNPSSHYLLTRRDEARAAVLRLVDRIVAAVPG